MSSSRLPSPETIVLNTLHRAKHDKWGFVIYRCTYASDTAWARFKFILLNRLRAEMRDSPDAPELAACLAWTFIEDRETLDGASRSALRERFKAWAADAIVSENPRCADSTQKDPRAYFGVPRYSYFVQIDEEALQSVLEAADSNLGHYWPEAYVNFVDARWRPFGDRYFDDGYEPDEDEILEPIDGCAEENVGWFRVQVSTVLSAEFYDAVVDFPGGTWHVFYRRPPEILDW
jgi:hypothetical protein